MKVIRGIYRHGAIELERRPNVEESDVEVRFLDRRSDEDQDAAWEALLRICERGFELGGEPWTREELYERRSRTS